MSKPKAKKKLPDLAPLISQALLDPHIDQKILSETCDATVHFGFESLCTNLIHIPAVRKRLGSSKTTKLIAAIAFPFGAIPSELKQAQVEWAAAEGADEIDVVPNFFALSKDKGESFAEELAVLCDKELPTNVILNIAHLTPEKLELAVNYALEVGAKGIQTGNGFGRSITSTEINKLTKLIRGRCSIKAAGGVQTLEQAFNLLAAGANTIGTSRGPDLMHSIRRVEG